MAAGRAADPTAAIIDSRTLRSSPESGTRAAYDGAKRKRGSKLHIAVDTLGHLLALRVTAANVDDRSEVGKLAEAVQQATGESVELIYADQGYTGRQTSRCGGTARHRVMRGQAGRSQEGICVAPQALGRRTVFRLGHQMPQVSQRLRTLRFNTCWLPRGRLRLPHAQTSRRTYAMCITPSKGCGSLINFPFCDGPMMACVVAAWQWRRLTLVTAWGSDGHLPKERPCANPNGRKPAVPA